MLLALNHSPIDQCSGQMFNSFKITGPRGLISTEPKRLRYATTGIYIIAVERFPCMHSNAVCAFTVKHAMQEGQNLPMPQVPKKRHYRKIKSRYLSIIMLRARPVLLRAGTRRSATAAVLPRSARSSLRTRLPASAALSRIARTSVVVACASVSGDTPAHAFSPRTRSKCVHHQVRLADSAACSATTEFSVASQPRTSRRCDGILQGCSKVPVWLDATLDAAL